MITISNIRYLMTIAVRKFKLNKIDLTIFKEPTKFYLKAMI